MLGVESNSYGLVKIGESTNKCVVVGCIVEHKCDDLFSQNVRVRTHKTDDAHLANQAKGLHCLPHYSGHIWAGLRALNDPKLDKTLF